MERLSTSGTSHALAGRLPHFVSIEWATWRCVIGSAQKYLWQPNQQTNPIPTFPIPSAFVPPAGDFSPRPLLSRSFPPRLSFLRSISRRRHSRPGEAPPLGVSGASRHRHARPVADCRLPSSPWPAGNSAGLAVSAACGSSGPLGLGGVWNL
jgi:hypothetical protein